MKPMLCVPGRRFKVLANSTENTLLKASVGFIAYPEFLFQYIGGDGNMNAINKVQVVVTRRGKKGKNRLEYHRIWVPALYHDALTPQLLNSNYTNLHLETKPENVLALKRIDFMAWASAMDTYFYNTSRSFSKHFAYDKIEKGNTSASNRLKRAIQTFEQGDEDAALESVGDPGFRSQYIEEMRVKESILREGLMKHREGFKKGLMSAARDLAYKVERRNGPKSIVASAKVICSLIERDGQEKVIKLLQT